MKKSLVVVESPAKAKTINKFLGKEYIVAASVGHVRDLPKSKLGVDLEHGFKPQYVRLPKKGKVLRELRNHAAQCDAVYLALDPDREGEAIAWHIAEELKETNSNIYRVLFYEITRSAVRDAIDKKREIDLDKVNAQQARRIMDRLMGYKISPFLWSKVRRGLSAGRVQSVALRLICDREREVRAFEPEEYWTVHADLLGSGKPLFAAEFHGVGGKKSKLSREAAAQEIEKKIQGRDWVLAGIEKKKRQQKPKPPFITSTLQQDASRRLRLPASKTMRIAQELYEGVSVGDEGLVGLITYMRTDSTRLSSESVQEVRKYVVENFGEEYIPKKPHLYAKSKKAQDAHEAIRPTSVARTPASLRGCLTAEQHRLYKLVWERFVACQMASARMSLTRFDIAVGEVEFRATGSIVDFPGHLKLYKPDEGDPEKKDAGGNAKDRLLPALQKGEVLDLKKLEKKQHFTQPPPRFNEASLIRELEKQGIGRPSTYATILSKIQDRKYTARLDHTFAPTELGFVVSDMLVEHFADVVNVGFTAALEEKLDQVEEGKLDWADLVGSFYRPFAADLERANQRAGKVDTKLEETDIPCDKCQTHMVIKLGRNGEFLACPRYPECRGTRNFKRDAQGKIVVEKPVILEEKCPDCGAELGVKSSRGSRFIGCTGYPECKFTRPFTLDVPCPKEDCKGELAEKRTRRGRTFYGCSTYPKCEFTTWQKPLPKPCPQCSHPFLVEKTTKRKGLQHRCPKKECGYEVQVDEAQPVGA